jgi:hypothetical protein
MHTITMPEEALHKGGRVSNAERRERAMRVLEQTEPKHSRDFSELDFEASYVPAPVRSVADTGLERQRYLNAVARLGTPRGACALSGVGPRQVWQWQAELGDAWAEQVASAMAMVHAELASKSLRRLHACLDLEPATSVTFQAAKFCLQSWDNGTWGSIEPTASAHKGPDTSETRRHNATRAVLDLATELGLSVIQDSEGVSTSLVVPPARAVFGDMPGADGDAETDGDGDESPEGDGA